MDNPTLPLPGLSPLYGKRLDVRFDGGMLSSDGGILLLREMAAFLWAIAQEVAPVAQA